MERLIRAAIAGLDRSGLRSVLLRGAVHEGGWVWAANHHSWWDGFATAAVLWSSGRRGSLLMDAEALGRFRYLRRVGVVGTDEFAAAAAAVRGGEPLVVFPEGELRPPGGVGELHRGAAVLALRSGCPLVPVATRAAMLAHAAPEYLVDIGGPIAPSDSRRMTAELGDALNEALRSLDVLVSTTGAYAPLPGFRVALRGRRDWDERFARRKGRR